MESLNTDSLMRMQVEQLEKEKKELNERMRVLTKRLDHVERAYRKEERPLLAKDYEVQQANDRAVFETTQKARLEASRAAHLQDVETKHRLTRMLNDYNTLKDSIHSRRGEEFAKMQATAQKKMAEEKAKRRAAVLKEREEEYQRLEEEERIRREQEEEEARLEAGLCFSFVVHAYVHPSPCRAHRRRGAQRRGGSRCSCCRRGKEARGRGGCRSQAQGAGRRAPTGDGGRSPPAAARGRGDGTSASRESASRRTYPCRRTRSRCTRGSGMEAAWSSQRSASCSLCYARQVRESGSEVPSGCPRLRRQQWRWWLARTPGSQREWSWRQHSREARIPRNHCIY